VPNFIKTPFNRYKGMNRNQKLILLGFITLLSLILAFLIKPIPQSAAYHQFADTRTAWGIENFFNVISNLPFIIIGCIGLALLPKARKGQLLAYSFLFIGIFLTGFGSGYYHLNPNNDTLVYDRIPMTIVFMALLSATISETINARLGRILLFPLLFVGIGSVLYWHFTESAGHGDLRLYGLVQFYPVLFIPLVLILFPSAQAWPGVRQLVCVVAWYVVAKVFEYFDWQIYDIGHFVSGHTLKHLAAAVSTWYLVKLFKTKYRV
jgi:hypothetical protein